MFEYHTKKCEEQGICVLYSRIDDKGVWFRSQSEAEGAGTLNNEERL